MNWGASLWGGWVEGVAQLNPATVAGSDPATALRPADVVDVLVFLATVLADDPVARTLPFGTAGVGHVHGAGPGLQSQGYAHRAVLVALCFLNRLLFRVLPLPS